MQLCHLAVVLKVIIYFYWCVQIYFVLSIDLNF